ncbi:hypothetical protein [Parasitella parasitica]|uniref:UBC core domain-containing protein n=1 Tax=Parasitella parasitica TaxID=35722 RepID=A0A0B7NF83_9FUNG|nr:hypothetical protein [Parasitella parasitica]
MVIFYAYILKKGKRSDWIPSLNPITTLPLLTKLLANPIPDNAVDAEIAEKYQTYLPTSIQKALEFTLKYANDVAVMVSNNNQSMEENKQQPSMEHTSNSDTQQHHQQQQEAIKKFFSEIMFSDDEDDDVLLHTFQLSKKKKLGIIKQPSKLLTMND